MLYRRQFLLRTLQQKNITQLLENFLQEKAMPILCLYQKRISQQ